MNFGSGVYNESDTEAVQNYVRHTNCRRRKGFIAYITLTNTHIYITM